MADSSERMTVEEKVESDLLWRLQGSLDEAIAYLTKLKAKYPGGRIIREREDYEDEYGLFLVIERPETDGEMNDRLAREKISAAVQEEHDRWTYERLKKKFGDA